MQSVITAETLTVTSIAASGKCRMTIPITASTAHIARNQATNKKLINFDRLFSQAWLLAFLLT
jgi:hypothetical protein